VIPDTLYFQRNNYSAPAQFTVRAVDDIAIEDPIHISVLKFEVVTDDPEYAKVVVPDIRVNIVDNEAKGKEVSVGRWGGTVSLTVPYGGSILSIPPGALKNDTVVQFREWEKPLEPGLAGIERNLGERGEIKARRVSGTYLFTPHGKMFDVPVTIAIEYDVKAAEVSGGMPYLLVSYNNTVGPWEIVEDAVFANGVASVRSYHFSTYYVAAGSVAPPPRDAPMPPPPLCTTEADSKVSDVEWGIISAFAVENLLLMALLAYFVVRRASAPKSAVLPMQIAYDRETGKPFALPAPNASKKASQLALTDEPVLLPGPYDGQPTVVTDATQVKVVNTLPEDALGAESVEMNTKV